MDCGLDLYYCWAILKFQIIDWVVKFKFIEIRTSRLGDIASFSYGVISRHRVARTWGLSRRGGYIFYLRYVP